MDQGQEKLARLHAIVEGRVQGVNFRYYTTRTAQRLDVTGWVANRQDGRVETIAEGPEDALQQLLDFLHEGPPSAIVTSVDAQWSAGTGAFTDFKVRYL